MKILTVGDVESKYLWNHFDKKRLKNIDLIISTGDLKSKYLSFLTTMVGAPLFYIPGNHDSGYKLNPPQGCINLDCKIRSFRNLRLLGFGGSMLYNKGVYQYSEKEMKKRTFFIRFKLFPFKKLDILFSHAPSKGICEGKDICHRGFEVFANLIDKYEPKYFIHGHQHLNYSRQKRVLKYKNTVVINSFDHFIFDYQKLYEKYFNSSINFQ